MQTYYTHILIKMLD
ncbi:hypothetical protein RDI58_012863 [Solanum bulbocastanum]|uniref:Uncharacterized protein n=1 Tax=Solanum bulbocastanum TaxID=147425 RepID=A0AAN8TLR4_SOLBU